MNVNVRAGSRLLKSGLAVAGTLLVAAQCAEPSLTISDGDFGQRSIASANTKLLTVTNTGSVDAVLGTVTSAALGLQPPFSLAGGTCVTGATLAGSSNRCTLLIAFSSEAAGSFSDELQLKYTWAGNAGAPRVATRALTGTSTASTNCFDTGCPAQHVCKEASSAVPLVGTCVLVPPPPANCMAPCLWELNRNCMPTLGACNLESGVLPDGAAICDSKTHWAMLEYRGVARTRIRETQRDGVRCYKDTWYAEAGLHEYSDGARVVGRGHDVSSTQSRFVDCEGDGTFNHEEGHSPECEAWKSAYLPSSCRSTSPGSCSGVYTLQ